MGILATIAMLCMGGNPAAKNKCQRELMMCVEKAPINAPKLDELWKCNIKRVK